MDIESAVLESTSTQKPVSGEQATHARKRPEPPLDTVGEENKLLNEIQGLPGNAAHTREASVDVCRGLATAMMIVVKYMANSVPVMMYAPWDGINVADFGPPMFLFLAGVSTALSHAHRTDRRPNQSNSSITATAKALRRSVWLFGLGVLLEGGFFHGKDNLSFGIDIRELRVLGTLQRIAVAYLATSLCEIWAPRSALWAMTALVPAASAALLYGLRVPDWSFPLLSADSASATSSTTTGSRNPCPDPANTASMAKVICGVRGFYNTRPTCNAAAHIDRLVLGHKYRNPSAWYKHLPECGGKGNRGNLVIPDWCYAPFESEGILSTLSATATSLIGLHFGHVLVEKQRHLARLWSWTLASAGLIVVGVALQNAGLPFNRQLWSFSYMCFTAGTAGTLLASVYFAVEASEWGGVSPLLQVVGRHSLLLFALLQCDVLPTLVQGFYHTCPQNNLWSYMADHHVFRPILQLLHTRSYR